MIDVVGRSAATMIFQAGKPNDEKTPAADAHTGILQQASNDCKNSNSEWCMIIYTHLRSIWNGKIVEVGWCWWPTRPARFYPVN